MSLGSKLAPKFAVVLLAASLRLCCTATAEVPVTSGLVLHLDAGAVAGLKDGDFVTVWPDSSGKGNHAYRGADAVDYPTYRAGVLNGHPVVRFGPNNSFFTFNEIADIRTVFWVCREETSATGNRFLLGHSTRWDFHRGWHKIWDSTWTHPRILNGITRLNGTAVNGTSAAIPWGRFSLISLVTTGTVQANQLTRDRNNAAAGWHGDIAEVLVYNRALTASQIADVEFYLNQKYFPPAEPADHAIFSPDGRIAASIVVDQTGHLALELRKAGITVQELSRIGITVDGFDLGQGVTVDWQQIPQTIYQTYPWRGLKSQAVNYCNAVSFPITHASAGVQWFLDCRVYNDGFAYRCRIPGSGSRTINGESAEWALPSGTVVWYQTDTSHYEGYYSKNLPSAIPAGTPIGFPVAAQLPDNGGYLLITEGALDNYSGMTLRAAGTNTLVSAFENRTYYDSAITGNAFSINGDIVSPWRITAAVDTLNELVNCDIVANVCPPPDPAYYPNGIQTDWIKPGKAVWNWWHNGDAADFELQKEYIDEAAELNCQYYVADAGWWGWAGGGRDEYYYLKQLCEYAAGKKIGIFVWAWLGSYQTSSSRAAFYDKLSQAGAAGVKFDFNNSESLDSMQLYKNALLEAASRRLMINFHGIVKPAGEARTWPNEITREGIIGLEWNRWDNIPPSHYALMPFTRLAAGHGDTTPCTLDPAYLKGTTYAFQIASAVVHHSPLLHWADQPDLYLSSPAVEMIRKIESCWDETKVLEGSRIGTLTAVAKRRGQEWFAAILNGDASQPIQYTLDLSFLDAGPYYVHVVKDNLADRPELTVQNTIVAAGQQMTVNLAAGGGYTANFSKLALSPRGGWFIGSCSVSINSFYENAQIRYTLDGSEPETDSLLYTAPITIDKSCLLRVKIVSGGGAGHEAKGWFTIIPPTPKRPDVYLSELDWASASCGWGTVRKNLSVEGRALKMAGQIYDKGIGTHADSEIVYPIDPMYTRFVAAAGIDDEITLNKASVVFRIEIDGRIAAQSPVIRRDGWSQFWHFSIPIPPGSRQLKIVSSGTRDGISYDHADWINAGFMCGYDFEDLTRIAQCWLQTDCSNTDACGQADLDGNGKIDFADLGYLAQRW